MVNYLSGPDDGGDGEFGYSLVVGKARDDTIPEPGSLVLLGVAGLGVLFRRRSV